MIFIINWINEWIQGIIIAVIIATIIEMIIPEGKNKKYIKTVIGIYILFTTIYPIIDKVSGKRVDLNEIMKTEIYASTDEDYKTMSNNLEKSTNENIEKSYIDTIKSDIKLYLENEGYEVKDIWINIETKDTTQYGEIKDINISMYQKKDINNTISKVEEIDVNFSKTKSNGKESQECPQIIKDYLIETYGINKENIVISFETKGG